MASSKLAIHHNTGREIERFAEFYHLARPPVALHLNLGDVEFGQMIGEQSPDTLIVGRKFFDSQRLNDPEEQARRVAGAILDSACARAGVIDTWVGYNEIGPHPTGDYYRFELELARRLHDAGMKYAAGSWSVGTPDVPDWLRNDQGGLSWFQLMLQVADYLALHSYCAPTMDDPRGLDADHPREGWFTLRYRKMMRHLEDQNLPFRVPPIIITECGIDSGATKWDAGAQGGWRSFTDAEGYMRQLAWYDEWLQGDPYVVGACIFQAGDISGKWTSFELIGHMLDVLQAYMVEEQGEEPGEVLPEWIDDLRGKLRVHETKTYLRRSLDDITIARFHHSAVAPSVGPYQFADYHVGVRDYPSCAYTYSIASDGHTYQCNDLEAITWHSGNPDRPGDENANSVGICLQGSFMHGLEPNDAQIRAALRLLDYLELTLGRRLEVDGHKDVIDTDCPGDTWDSWKWRLIEPEPPPPKNDWKQMYLAEKAKVEAVRRIVC